MSDFFESSISYFLPFLETFDLLIVLDVNISKNEQHLNKFGESICDAHQSEEKVDICKEFYSKYSSYHRKKKHKEYDGFELKFISC